jgi:Flp pilus assembly protein TadD
MGFGKRVFRFLTAPLRYLYRRPGHALVYLFLTAGALTLLATITLLVLFNYHLRIASAELELGHNRTAVEHLEWCRWVRPEQRDVLILSARAARRFGSWDEADALLSRYWERYGDEELVVFERLLLRASRGDLESTASPLRARIAEGGQQSRLAREALATGLLYRFRWNEAQAVLDEWLLERPDDTLALLISGKLLEQQLGDEQATEKYRRIVELDPQQDEARLRLATLLVNRRLVDEAAAELQVLRVRLPDHAEVQVLWARALGLLGRTQEARAVIDACLTQHPDFPPALLERGQSSLLDGDEIAAEEYLGKAIRLDPGNGQARNQYALALARNGKKAEAAAEYVAIKQLETDNERITALISGPLQTRPNDPSIHHEIGMVALRGGLKNEAMRWLTSALNVDPNHLPTHRTLTELYYELDNPILAARHRAILQQLSAQQRNR